MVCGLDLGQGGKGLVAFSGRLGYGLLGEAGGWSCPFLGWVTGGICGVWVWNLTAVMPDVKSTLFLVRCIVLCLHLLISLTSSI